jgi:hypothetical protein
MALTRETIIANAALATLTEDQTKALETLSANDENVVIGKRIGEVYREMDTKIEETTGIKRDGDEKTYLYLARAAAGLKDQVSELGTFKTQVADLTKEKLRLEKAITDGTADAETKRALTQAKADLTAITNQYNTLKTEHDTAKETHEKELFGVQVQNDLSGAKQGIAFKAGIPTSATDVLLEQALGKVKAMTPEYIDNGQGGKMLVFKDKDGAIMRNPENQLNPYTAADLVQKELKGLGVLDEGRKQGGAGSQQQQQQQQQQGVVIDVKAAKTRVEANEAITSSLMAQGLVNGTDAYQTALDAAWKDNNVAALPEK